MNPATIAVTKALQDPGSLHHLAATDVYLHFDVWPVPMDGQCLWTALAAAYVVESEPSLATQQLRDELEELLRDDSRLPLFARAIRRSAWRCLRDRTTGNLKESYAPFYAGGEEGTAKAQTHAEYLHQLKHGNVFGGPLEIQALCDHDGEACVVIFNEVPHEGPDRNMYAVAYTPNTEARVLRRPLLLLRRNWHYDALLPLRGTSVRRHQSVPCASASTRRLRPHITQ